MFDKPIRKLYYSIGEVSEMNNLESYVLRYWESEFSQLKPSKNKAGNRTYTESDIAVIVKIKTLLYVDKFTIEGARQQLNTETTPNKNLEKSESIGEPEKRSATGIQQNEDNNNTLKDIKKGLVEILDKLDK